MAIKVVLALREYLTSEESELCGRVSLMNQISN